jgi:hypothetical protein
MYKTAMAKCLTSVRNDRAAQQPHAAIGEMNKVHARQGIASFSISDYAPQEWRAVADAGR